jgi:ParB family chromosome partitioning protein
MKKVEELLRNGAAHMASSLGVGAAPPPAPPAAKPQADKYAGRTRGNTGEMAIDNIIPDPDQPRKTFDDDDLERLAQSIRTHGQLQPIRVRWSGEHGKWLTIAGERRLRAAQRAGLAKVACVFVEDETVSEAAVLEEQIIENLLRSDLKPIEQALAFRRLMDLTGWTGKEVAERLHLHRTSVTRMLQLLELPQSVQERIDRGEIPASVGVELTKLDDQAEQLEVAEKVVTEMLTRDEVAQTVQAAKRKSPKPAPKSKRPAKEKSFTFKSQDRSTVTVILKKAGTLEDARRVLLEIVASLPTASAQEDELAA